MNDPDPQLLLPLFEPDDITTVPPEEQEEPEPGPWFTDWLPPTGDDQ